MTPDWVTIYTESNPLRAEIVKNALEAEGISCTLENEHQAGEAGVAALPIKVQVPASEAARARRIIQRHDPKAD